MPSRPRSPFVFPATARVLAILALTTLLAPPSSLRAQPPAIAEKTRGLEKRDGFVPLYWDPAAGKLWMEIPAALAGKELLYITGAPTGLGSNDLGLGRGQIGGEWLGGFARMGT